MRTKVTDFALSAVMLSVVGTMDITKIETRHLAQLVKAITDDKGIT